MNRKLIPISVMTVIAVLCLISLVFAEKICPKCHTKYSDTYEYCTTDGTKLKKIEVPQTKPPVKPQAKSQPQATTGVLEVKSSITGAKVYIDDEYSGIVPFSMGLKEGSYVIVVKEDGYEPQSEKVRVRAGRTLTLDVKLKSKVEITKPATLPPKNTEAVKYQGKQKKDEKVTKTAKKATTAEKTSAIEVTPTLKDLNGKWLGNVPSYSASAHDWHPDTTFKGSKVKMESLVRTLNPCTVSIEGNTVHIHRINTKNVVWDFYLKLYQNGDTLILDGKYTSTDKNFKSGNARFTKSGASTMKVTEMGK